MPVAARSVQVLNELANVARRRMGLGWDETADLLAAVRAFVTVEPLTVETTSSGWRWPSGTGFRSTTR